MDEPSTLRKPFYRRDPLTTIAFTFLIFIFSQVIAALVLGIYPALKNWTEAQATEWLVRSVPANFIYKLVSYGLATYAVWQLIIRAKIIPERLGFKRFKIQDIGYALISYVIYFIAYLAIITIATDLISSLNIDQKQITGFEIAYSSKELLLTFISLVIFPPIAEEIMFRGYLFTSLRVKYSFAVTTLVTSLLFGVVHLQFGSGAPLLWVAAIDTFILSCILCTLRERSGSLWPPILLHAFKNFVAFIILFGNRF